MVSKMGKVEKEKDQRKGDRLRQDHIHIFPGRDIQKTESIILSNCLLTRLEIQHVSTLLKLSYREIP